MKQKKFSDLQLEQLLRQGLSCSEIASRLGVDKSTVSKRLKALKISVAKHLTFSSAGEVVRKELDILGQLQKINRHANGLLDMLMRWNEGDAEALQFFESWARKVCAGGAEDEGLGLKLRDPRELALKAMREIRGQIRLQFEISQTLYDMQAVKEFQSEVLEIIGSVSPDAREQIIRRLTQKSALQSALDLN